MPGAAAGLLTEAQRSGRDVQMGALQRFKIDLKTPIGTDPISADDATVSGEVGKEALSVNIG